MNRKTSVGMVGSVLCAVMCLGALSWTASPALAQPWPMPPVVLDVHPNERGPGYTNPATWLGGPPWTSPLAAPTRVYWWQEHYFAASGILWVQVCAQNYSAVQNGYGDDDDLRVTINGFVPVDYDTIQNGPWGSYQWDGDTEAGRRWTLRFLCTWGTPGLQNIRIAADEAPILWWIRVVDLEEQLIFPAD